MRSFLLRCYPARWRARYGGEFRAVLDECALGANDVVDILRGAVDAQLQARWTGISAPDGRVSLVAARVGGIAAILGAPLWTAGFVIGSAHGAAGDGRLLPVGAVLVIGSLLMLAAMLGLSVTQASVRPVLAWSSFALPASGAIAMTIGAAIVVLDGTLSEALFLGLLMFFVGSVLFGLVAVHVGALSRTAATLLAVASIVTLAGGDGEGAGQGLIVGGLIAFDAAWIGLGALAAIRTRPTATARMA